LRFEKELDELYPKAELSLLVADYKKETDPARKQDKRNCILYQHVRDVRAYHEAVETDLFETSSFIGFDLDVGTLLATTIATAVTPVGTKTLWSAIASVTGGARLAASKNFLDERNRSVVLASMRSQRARKLAALFEKMETGADKYPLEQGLIDVVDLMNSGSVASAISEMSKAAEAKLDDAQRNLDAASKELLK
jgi:shikimate 5-dehydrogenase